MSSQNHSKTFSSNESNRKSSSSSSKLKNYQPKFTPVIELPSIQCFQLDYILNNVLSKESEQLKSDLLTVSSNYQNDLRQQIKYKLSIEQKIQFKNIEIAKSASSLNKSILSKKKKLTKCLTNTRNNQIDSDMEVNQLLKNTIEVSSKIKSTIEKLNLLDKKLRHHDDEDYDESIIFTKRELYPNLYKLMNKGKSVEVEKIVEHEVNEPNESYFDSPHDTTVNEDEPAVELQQEVEETRLPMNGLITPPSLQQAQLTDNEEDDDDDEPVGDELDQEDMDAIQFETFMNSSIAKYRNLQNKKHLDPFKNITTISKNDSLSSNGTTSNPLTLLYSQLISNPKYIESQKNGRFPFSNLVTIKSTATTESTQQDSHFKKLRINGAPITSANLRKNKDKCKCNHEDDEVATSAEALLGSLKLNDSEYDGEGELWTSSELNTDEETIEELLTSDSSDSDSSIDLGGGGSREFSHITSTNQYYYNLNSGLKQKRKEKLLSQKKKKNRKHRKSLVRRPKPKELSPSPKHIPSHRILKPKRSILKTNAVGSKKFSRENSPFRRANFATERMDDKLSEEVSALSAVNNAFGSKTNNTITNFTAQGTIIPLKESSPTYEPAELNTSSSVSEPTESPQPQVASSLSLLKSYVQ